MAIANLLRELGVAYAYRQPLAGSQRPGEREPAFTLLDRDRQPVLWEHLTYREDEEQRSCWQERQAWYAENGFDVGINLFVTRDEPDGSVNPARLRKVAEFVRSLCA